METTDFVAALEARRLAEGLSQHAFALRLGINPGHLSVVLARKRAPGPKVIQAVLAAYPELAPEALIFLRRSFDQTKWQRRGGA